MAEPTNPRAVIGSNTADAPDYAKIETDRLADEYAKLVQESDALLAEAAAIPDEINDDETKGVVTSLIKRIRDAKVRIEGLHDLEKQPFLRRGQGVDQFFFGIWDKLVRRDRKNKEGAGDRLNRILTDYDTKVLRRKQEEARRIAEAAAAEERRRREEAEALARKAEEERLAAERARKPETIAAKTEQATATAEAASTAKVEAEVAGARAEAAYVDTLAKPADIMRTRGSDGTLSTMATEPYAVVTDITKLDGAKLWAQVSAAEKEKALARWARLTDYREQMAGASIGRRPKSVVR